MALERDKVRKALLAKGFVEDGSNKNRDHDVYFLECHPIEPVWTKLSRGKGYRTLGHDLEAKVATQLRLKKPQLRELVACPLTKREYLEHLRKLGLLPPET